MTFLAQRGCRRFADVTRPDMEAYMAYLGTEAVAKSSRLRSATLTRRFFERLQDQGTIVGNPAKGMPVPDDGEADLPAPPLSEEEVAGIIDGLPRASVYDLRAVCLLELLYGCGLRISEALNLDLDDLELHRRTVLIRESKHDQTRVVPLPKTARTALQTYLTLRKTLVAGPDRGAVFLTQQGKRWAMGSVYGFFKMLHWKGVSPGRRLHPHIFRHSIAVHLLRRGADKGWTWPSASLQ